MDRGHIVSSVTFLHTIIVLEHGMSLVNIYWVKIWSSVYFCSLPVLSISTLWLLMFASYLLSLTMADTWEVVQKHLREGWIRPTWWHWWQEQDPQLCKHTHLVMSSIAVCRTFDLGRELQYPRQGWTFPVHHLSNTVRSGPHSHHAAGDTTKAQRGQVTCPKFTQRLCGGDSGVTRLRLSLQILSS